MITTKKEGARVYFQGDTYPFRDRIKSMGGHWDADSRRWWVGAKKLAEAEALAAESAGPAAESAERKPEDPDNIRLTGKATYQGKTYFVGSSTRDGLRVRLLTLPGKDGKYLDFWADSTEVQMSKRYEPRPERGSYGRPTGRMVHQTLGSIARFIARQEQAKAEGLPACAQCGKRGHLIEDLEDGLLKCPGCCDMPSGGY